MSDSGQRIGIVGGGIAGILSAYILSKRHEVVLIEKNSSLGGHTNTVVLSGGPDAGMAIDTGFIVLNDRTYPTLHNFFSQLNVPVRSADMSFGFYDENSGLQYAGTNLQGLFAHWKNLINPFYVSMLFELQRFNRRALADLLNDRVGDQTFAEYLESIRVTHYLRDNYLVPMGAAIWSSPDQGILDFPAETFLRFFYHHGLLTLGDRPQWQTVVGGSHSYVKQFEEKFSGTLIVGHSVKVVQREENGVVVILDDQRQLEFDRVVIAAHADQVLPLLSNPTDEECSLFSRWKYQLNQVVLHTDQSVLPPSTAAWASWNYTREKLADGTRPVSVSYHMNRLQGLKSDSQYCVTLNRRKRVHQGAIIREIDYYHPVFSAEAVRTVPRIRQCSGVGRIHYCGSYFGYGFHEDAALSAQKVAEEFGDSL